MKCIGLFTQDVGEYVNAAVGINGIVTTTVSVAVQLPSLAVTTQIPEPTVMDCMVEPLFHK